MTGEAKPNHERRFALTDVGVEGVGVEGRDDRCGRDVEGPASALLSMFGSTCERPLAVVQDAA